MMTIIKRRRDEVTPDNDRANISRLAIRIVLPSRFASVSRRDDRESETTTSTTTRAVTRGSRGHTLQRGMPAHVIVGLSL